MMPVIYREAILFLKRSLNAYSRNVVFIFLLFSGLTLTATAMGASAQDTVSVSIARPLIVATNSDMSFGYLRVGIIQEAYDAVQIGTKASLVKQNNCQTLTLTDLNIGLKCIALRNSPKQIAFDAYLSNLYKFSLLKLNQNNYRWVYSLIEKLSTKAANGEVINFIPSKYRGIVQKYLCRQCLLEKINLLNKVAT
jgi:hypothetical protein